MNVMFCIGIILVICVVGICIGVINEYEDPFLFSVFLCAMTVIGFGLIITAYQGVPSALDVYQGKTELRITYEGQTPVDSTVIYKK